MSAGNKLLKEGIRHYKRISSYEQIEGMVRSKNITLTREEAIDFLRDMNDDLQKRFNCRNIYMIVSSEPLEANTRSCTFLPAPQESDQHQFTCLR